MPSYNVRYIASQSADYGKNDRFLLSDTVFRIGLCKRSMHGASLSDVFSYTETWLDNQTRPVLMVCFFILC